LDKHEGKPRSPKKGLSKRITQGKGKKTCKKKRKRQREDIERRVKSKGGGGKKKARCERVIEKLGQKNLETLTAAMISEEARSFSSDYAAQKK